MNSIICIVGTTASGKTDLSVQLAKHYDTEIISADSVQVYKGLDIGSAKPDLEEMQGICHHMISCVDINDKSFSVSKYREMAEPVVLDLLNKNKIPILTGGSGLYVSSVISPLNFAVESDDKIRKKLEEAYDKDAEALYKELKNIDPETAERLHVNDKKRIVRAMEVIEITHRKFSEYATSFEENNRKNLFDTLKIGIDIERTELYNRINQRVELMLEKGLMDEAKSIYDFGYDRNLPAMQSIGYKELFDYFDGNCSLDEAVEKIKQNTRRYAKRQLTWYRRDADVKWIQFSEDKTLMYRQAIQICDAFLEGK